MLLTMILTFSAGFCFAFAIADALGEAPMSSESASAASQAGARHCHAPEEAQQAGDRAVQDPTHHAIWYRLAEATDEPSDETLL